MVEPTMHALAACALLHTFDADVLQAVLGIDDLAATFLLSRTEVEAVAEGMYAVRRDHLPSLIDALRRTRPDDEYAIHRRAFDYYLQRLRAIDHAQQRASFETLCMRHLCRVRDLNIDYIRWDDVSVMIAQLRAAVPKLQQQHADQLAVFDADAAIRRQDYSLATMILEQLLRRSDLHPGVRAKTLFACGFVEMSHARFEPALALFGQAFELAEQVGDFALQGAALINQSWMYNELQQFDIALRLSQQSLAAYQVGNDLYGAAYALYSIGNNALYLGEWDIGRQHLDQAATIYEAAGMMANLAMVDWARGYLYQVLGDEETSKQAYVRALQTATSPEHGNTRTTVDTLKQLGLLYQVQEDWLQASDAFTRSLTLAEKIGDDHCYAMLLHRKALLLRQLGDDDTARELLGEAVDRIERLRVSISGEELKLGLLGTAQQVYESIILTYLDRGDVASAFSYVERARARAFLDLLAQRDTTLEFVPQYQPVELQQLQNHLAPGVLVLEYHTIGVIPAGAHFLSRIPPENTRLRSLLSTRPEILLFAITADNVTVQRIDFDPNLLQPSLFNQLGAQLLTERKLRWLYTKVLAPVEQQLAECDVLHLIPHGPLHLAPFVALRKPDSEPLLKASGPVTLYAPSATILCACLDQAPSTALQTLALAYNDDGAAALWFAEREAQLVGQLVGAAVHSGSAPKRDALLRLGPQLRWLHIAGHAVYDPDDPLGSYLRLGANDNLDARSLMQQLRLNATLVTLNACTTGVSHVASGDELLGLPRAFLYAGAATIVCALSEVDDLAAFVLMLQFYERLARGLKPSVAMHQAQLALRTLDRDEVKHLLQHALTDSEAMPVHLDDYDDVPFAHPRYWAPFIVIGKP